MMSTPEKIPPHIVALHALFKKESGGYDPLDSFFGMCVTGKIEESVKNSGKTLVDREFVGEDIEKMNSIKLNQLDDLEKHEKYNTQIGKGGKQFFDINGIAFSARGGEDKLELRGNRLKRKLNPLRKSNPDMTLYNALNFLIKTDTEMPAQGFHSALLSLTSIRAFPDNAYLRPIIEESKDTIVKAITKLSAACIKYMLKERKQGIPDKTIIEELKTSIRDESFDPNIILLASIGNISESFLLTSIEKKIKSNKEEQTAKFQNLKKTGNPYKITGLEKNIATKHEIPQTSTFRKKSGVLFRFRPSILKKIDRELNKFHTGKTQVARYVNAREINTLIEKALKLDPPLADKRLDEVKALKAKITPLIKDYEKSFGIDVESTRSIYGEDIDVENRSNYHP